VFGIISECRWASFRNERSASPETPGRQKPTQYTHLNCGSHELRAGQTFVALLLSCRMVPLLHPPDGFVKIGQIDVGGKEITFSRTILTVPWSMPEHNAEARG